MAAATTTSSSPKQNAHQGHQDADVTETIQSLIVAFVLAMMFRGFVIEGFVIPTGSMAPTLLGEHVLVRSPQTGYEYAIGVDANSAKATMQSDFKDPIIGRQYRMNGRENTSVRSTSNGKVRMGDRILVLKSLYPFVEPDRFDVVVFKNPTEPNGAKGNYIKRLIGLPEEDLWLADGDVFVEPWDDASGFQIQRKPDHVQRAVWQTIHRMEFTPVLPETLSPAYNGPPWRGEGDNWTIDERGVIRCDTADESVLNWDGMERQISDVNPYNFNPRRGSTTHFRLSDMRVSGAIAPTEDGLQSTFELNARGHIFEFVLGDDKATVRFRPQEQQAWTQSVSEDVSLPGAGGVCNVEFWHVDQRMAIFINDSLVVELMYDWSAADRLRYSTGSDMDQDINVVASKTMTSPSFRWLFEGSPVALHRVHVDRDLYYRPVRLKASSNEQKNTSADGKRASGPGFATHPESIAQLREDQFLCLGDNSAASLDSRLWGYPHPAVANTIDPSPFVVHRKLMMGKAWVVYFPAPQNLTEKGMTIIPDFGKLRFIR